MKRCKQKSLKTVKYKQIAFYINTEVIKVVNCTYEPVDWMVRTKMTHWMILMLMMIMRGRRRRRSWRRMKRAPMQCRLARRRAGCSEARMMLASLPLSRTE